MREDLMGRARHIYGLVLALSLGAANAAPGQSSSATWQSTPASILKSTLRSVVAAQDKYRETHPGFASSVEALRVKPGSEVTVQILGVTSSGWRAKATHKARPGRSCVVFVGKLRATEFPRTDGGEMAGEERVPLCDRME
ncbi:MAG: hypothetical protein ACXWWK_01220 [Gemmatimonadales bacterium]